MVRGTEGESKTESQLKKCERSAAVKKEHGNIQFGEGGRGGGRLAYKALDAGQFCTSFLLIPPLVYSSVCLLSYILSFRMDLESRIKAYRFVAYSAVAFSVSSLTF